MGAISSADSTVILTKYLTDSNRSVRETCEIALAKIQWDNSEEGRQHVASRECSDKKYVALHPLARISVTQAHITSCRTYTSIDPAPPSSKLLSGQPKPDDISDSAIASLRTTLLDTSVSLFERYRAMFALRNIGTAEAVNALAAGFSDDSALFKFVSFHFFLSV